MSCLCTNTYMCVRGRWFSNFRFVIFKQRVSEKKVTDCLPDRIAVAFYRGRVIVVEVRENIRPPGQGQQWRRQSFCDILCIYSHKQTIIILYVYIIRVYKGQNYMRMVYNIIMCTWSGQAPRGGRYWGGFSDG